MYSKTLPLVALAGVAQAHMSMYYPPPLGSAPSINPQSTSLDKEFNYPLGCCGSDGTPDEPSPGLCRGYLDKYDTETATVTWEAGQDAHFQLTDYSYDPQAPGSTHSGGSCQVGFSVDRGVTWKVAASYHGACPYETEDGSPEAQTFDFKVPTGMPEGDALFAWIWLNREHESFMNCAKVKIGAGSGNSTTPSQSYPSAGTSSTPNQPAQSGTYPKQPSSATSPQEPSYPSTEPQQSGDGEGDYPASPTQPSQASHHHHHHHHSSTAIHASKPTQTPDDDDSEGSDDDDYSSDSDSNQESSTSYLAHREVKAGARRYVVDNAKCECRRDEMTLAARCFCDASEEKRGAIERKALRMHRRTFYKRVDACNWESAPAMQVSYYTVDAKCAPNAKMNMPESDDFELKWDVSCGVVEGKTDYKLQTMNCNMYGGK